MAFVPDGELVPEVARGRRGPWFVFREPLGFEWTTLRLPVAGLTSELHGLKLIHLSDLHLRAAWSRAYDQLIHRVEAAAADLVLITGDFIDDKHDHRRALEILKRLTPRLRARLGLWGILGNHDPDIVAPYLSELGVNMIDGRWATLESPSGARVELIGLPGGDRADLDGHFVASIPPRSPGSLRVVLSHYPDHVRRVRPLDADLFLAGHTHGGQCCLPGGWPIIKHDSLPRRLCKGINRYGGTWMVVSRGLGFAGIPLRVFCPGEAAELVIVGGKIRDER